MITALLVTIGFVAALVLALSSYATGHACGWQAAMHVAIAEAEKAAAEAAKE